jgi:hypothetical protein
MGSLFRRLFSAVVPGRQDSADTAKTSKTAETAPTPAAPTEEGPPTTRDPSPDGAMASAEAAPGSAGAASAPTGPVEVGPFPGPFQHVGFALAHAAYVASTFEGPAGLMPLAVVAREGKTMLSWFAADTQFDAITEGKAEMAKLGATADVWAFARDGIWDEETVPTDAISVDFWVKGMNAPATVVQLYESLAKHGHFRLLDEPKLITLGKVRLDDKARLTIAAILQGIRHHPQAAILWPGWK